MEQKFNTLFLWDAADKFWYDSLFVGQSKSRIFQKIILINLELSRLKKIQKYLIF